MIGCGYKVWHVFLKCLLSDWTHVGNLEGHDNDSQGKVSCSTPLQGQGRHGYHCSLRLARETHIQTAQSNETSSFEVGEEGKRKANESHNQSCYMKRTMHLGEGGGREEGEREGERGGREGGGRRVERGISYHHLTWNHSPLGRAGFIQAAKKMAVKARSGHAISMRMP